MAVRSNITILWALGILAAVLLGFAAGIGTYHALLLDAPREIAPQVELAELSHSQNDADQLDADQLIDQLQESRANLALISSSRDAAENALVRAEEALKVAHRQITSLAADLNDAKALTGLDCISCEQGGMLEGRGCCGIGRLEAVFTWSGRLCIAEYEIYEGKTYVHFILDGEPWPTGNWGLEAKTFEARCR